MRCYLSTANGEASTHFLVSNFQASWSVDCAGTGALALIPVAILLRYITTVFFGETVCNSCWTYSHRSFQVWFNRISNRRGKLHPKWSWTSLSIFTADIEFPPHRTKLASSLGFSHSSADIASSQTDCMKCNQLSREGCFHFLLVAICKMNSFIRERSSNLNSIIKN